MSVSPELKYDINLTTLEEFNKVTLPGFPFFAENTVRTFFANGRYPWHWHPTVQFFYVTEGRMRYTIPGGAYTFGRGEGAFINAHILHMLDYPDRDPCSFLCFLFHPSLIGGEPASDMMRKYVRPITDNPGFDIFLFRKEIPAHAKILSLLTECYALYESREKYYELKIRMKLTEMWMMFEGLTEDARNSRTENTSSDRIKKIITYMNENYMEDLTLEKIAAAGACSRRECDRAFRTLLHTTPFDYLRTLRLEKACEYLSDTSLSVTEIGSACGFNGASYFGHLFKEAYGMSPGEYRHTVLTGDGSS